MASNAVIGALRVNLGLDSAQFQTGLKSVQKGMDGLGAHALKMGSVIGKGLLSGFAVGGGLGVLAAGLQRAAGSIALVGDAAKRAGLSNRAFQELAFVARDNRVAVDSLVDGIKEMNLRADEFIVTGGGSAAEAFKRLGYGATDLADKLHDPSALFSEIIGKVHSLDGAAQIRVLDEIFGGQGGEQFLLFLDQGQEGIRRTIDEAHRLNLVLSDETIAHAAEIDRQFNRIADTVSNSLQAAIVDATASLVDFLLTLPNTPAENLADANAELAAMRQNLIEVAAGYTESFPELEAKIVAVIDRLLTSRITAAEAKAELMGIGTDPDYAGLVMDLSGLITRLDQLKAHAGEAAVAVREATSDPIGSMPTFAEVTSLAKPALPVPLISPPPSSSGSGGALITVPPEFGASLEVATDQVENMGTTMQDALRGVSGSLTGIATDMRRAFGEGELSAQSMFESIGKAAGNLADQLISSGIDQLLGNIVGAAVGSIGGGGFGLGAGAIGRGVYGGGGGVFGIPGFAEGGFGRIAGVGSMDSKLLMARVTPGEAFAFGDDAMKGEGMSVTVNVDARGAARGAGQEIADAVVARIDRQFGEAARAAVLRDPYRHNNFIR